MPAIQMRPTFFLETTLSRHEIMRRVKNSFGGGETSDETGEPAFTSDYEGQFARDQAMISIKESQRHFWSPWMHLEIREHDESRMVHVRFSPHPGIWTGFMFSYFILVVLVFFAAIFGISQQISGQSPVAYLFIPFGIIFAALLWVAARMGQVLAQVEMQQMTQRIKNCIGHQN